MIFIKYDSAEVRMNGKNNIISFFKLRNHPKFLEIRNNLYCPEEGCDARLVFNQRRGGFLAKHRSFEHVEDCTHFELDTKTAKKYEQIETIHGNLSSKGIKNKMKYGWEEFDKYLNPDKKRANKPKRNSRRRKTTENSETQKRIVISPNSKNNIEPSKNDTLSDIIKQEPRYNHRPLDQIDSDDINLNLTVVAEITSINIVNDKNIKINVKLNNAIGEFRLPESFFVSNNHYNSEQLIDFLKIIEQFLQSSSKVIYILALCHPKKIDNKYKQFAVYDPNHISFRIPDSKTVNLVTFVALINTKAI